MPELPEVEIICRELNSKTESFTIKKTFSSSKKFKRTLPNLDCILGQKIHEIHRRNKYIIFNLTDFWLVFHLGMTGNLIFNNLEKLQKHIHIILESTNGNNIFFVDPRRFGSVDLFKKETFKDYKQIPLFHNLGLEPLEKSFTFISFLNLLKIKKNIKNFLMDSKFVCGIGNIYASEILFLSKINPLRDTSTLTNNEKKLLYKNIKEVLTKAIEMGGSSISDFVHTNGKKGEMQNFYNVYGLQKKPCSCCKSTIEKITQNSRSTYFCPNCQH